MAKKTVAQKQSAIKCADYIGDALHIMRIMKGMTQEEVALKLSELVDLGPNESIGQDYISKVENKAFFPGWNRIEPYCQVLNCRLSELFFAAERVCENDLTYASEKDILEQLRKELSERLVQ